MPKVLLLGESYSAGVKTYIDTIMRHQDQFPDTQFKVLVSSKRMEAGNPIDQKYCIEDNLSFGKSPVKLVRALKRLHRMVTENDIEIIHANSTYVGVLIYFYSFWNRKVSYIYTPHGYYSFKKMKEYKQFLVRFAEKKINRISNTVIHVSDSEEQEAIGNKLVVPHKSAVIVNGVRDPERKSKKESDHLFTIVNLARVDEQKNPFEFIEIAKSILTLNDEVQFIWAGSGKYLEAARDLVKSYKLEEKVKFIGFSDQKDEILEHSDLYLSTSNYEGLPFSVVEAMSYKLPLVLTDIIGHTDLIDNNENGFLFKHKEYRTVYEFIHSVIANQEKWETMSNSSYRIYNERFNINQMMKKLSEVYKSV